jgi:hypothetical protein
VNDFERYEDELTQRLKNLSLPDKKMVWEKMEKLLDNGGGNGGFTPPSSSGPGNKPWGWGVFGLLLILGIVWFCFHVSQNKNTGDNNKVENKIAESNTSLKNSTTDATIKNDQEQNKNASSMTSVKTGEVQKTDNIFDSVVNKKNNTIPDTINSSEPNAGTNNHASNDVKIIASNRSQPFKSGKGVAVVSNKKNKAIPDSVNLSEEAPAANNGPSNKAKIVTGNKPQLFKPGKSITGVDVSTSGSTKTLRPHSKIKTNKTTLQQTFDVTEDDKPRAGKVIAQKNTIYHLTTTRRKLYKKESVEKKLSLGSTKKDPGITKKEKYKSSMRHLGVEEDLTEQDHVNKTTTVISKNKYAMQPTVDTPAVIDSIKHKDSVIVKSLPKTANDSSATVKKKDQKDKKLKAYFAAGLAAQQSVNVNCNCSYPTSTNTNAGTVTDFLPAAYLRFYSTKKWFLQAAFKYATPQHIGDFMYKSELSGLVDTSYVLRDVYYHQVPLSFNYTILPNWSIGVGVVYNIYSSELRQEDISKKNYGLPDSLISSTVIKDKKDSNFLTLSNYFQALFETNYEWKHFSIGISYTMALQSFAEYADPFSGLPASKRNNSLNIFIRYELWRSKAAK